MTEEPLVTEEGLVAFVCALAQTIREIETLSTVGGDVQAVFRERLRYLVDASAHPSNGPLSEKDQTSLYRLHGLLEMTLRRPDPILIEIDSTYGFS